MGGLPFSGGLGMLTQASLGHGSFPNTMQSPLLQSSSGAASMQSSMGSGAAAPGTAASLQGAAGLSSVYGGSDADRLALLRTLGQQQPKPEGPN